MAALETPDVNTGWKAADFKLPGTDGKNYSLREVKGTNGLLVMFICNHCPFVQAIAEKIARDTKELQSLGIGVAAISANDVQNYPEDDLPHMKEMHKKYGFTFPYLYDETQNVAKAYGAVCTPDFFGFNNKLELQYRGRLDDSGMQKKPGGKRELFEAMKLIAQTGNAPGIQKPSIGCSIKWKQAA